MPAATPLAPPPAAVEPAWNADRALPAADDKVDATALLHAVTATPQSILTGIKTAETLIANHA